MQESIKLYLIQGTAQSGRREILYDLIEGSSHPNEGKNIILLNSTETKHPSTEKLQELPNTTVLEWNFLDNELKLPDFKALSHDKVFLTLSPKDDLIDQIESVQYWLEKNPRFSLARILSVIDCQLAYENVNFLPWFEAVVYFSDYVFLTHRDNVPEKWISDFIKSFEKKSYPCLFEKIKKNKIANPNQVLEPEARRITHIFDNLDAIDTLDLDEEHLPEEPFELLKKADHYLERDDEGNRIIKLPSISN